MLSARELLCKILNEISESGSPKHYYTNHERIDEMLNYLITLKYIVLFEDEAQVSYTLTERGKRMLSIFMEENRNV